MRKFIFIPLIMAVAAIVGLSSCSQEASANNNDNPTGPGLGQEPDPDFGTTILYQQRVSEFELLKITENDIVFVGNSLISRGEWNELLENPNIKNRGISGDTTRGILERLNMIAVGKPAMIFLMAGINDIASGISTNGILENMTVIVNQIRELSPNTKIFLHSLLPVGPSFKPFISEAILTVNQGYREIAEENDVVFIDLYDSFVNDNGYLNPSLTNDDLHLLGEGYIIWATILARYIDPSK